MDQRTKIEERVAALRLAGAWKIQIACGALKHRIPLENLKNGRKVMLELFPAQRLDSLPDSDIDHIILKTIRADLTR
ncbi:MAG: hypothetical protein ACREQK_08220 [Candidatus Binatia bacterium]